MTQCKRHSTSVRSTRELTSIRLRTHVHGGHSRSLDLATPFSLFSRARAVAASWRSKKGGSSPLLFPLPIADALFPQSRNHSARARRSAGGREGWPGNRGAARPVRCSTQTSGADEEMSVDRNRRNVR